MTRTTTKPHRLTAMFGAVAAAALIAGAPAAMAEGGQKSHSGSYQSSEGMSGSSSSGSQSYQGQSGASGNSQAQVSSSEVREIQQALDQSGHDPGEVDGIWGQQTASALKDFQQSNGLQATGQPDRQTLAALGVTESSSGTSGSGSGSSSGSFENSGSSDKGNTALPRSRSNAGGAAGSAEDPPPR